VSPATHRRHSLRCDRTAAGRQYFTQLNTYHIILEVTRSFSKTQLADKLYVSSATLDKQIPLSSFVKVDNTRTNYLSVSHQGQFPAITISFNLAAAMAGRCRGGDPSIA